MCGAQWELELRPNCPVCLSFAYDRVPPTPGDLLGLYADLVLLVGDLMAVEASDAHRELARVVADLQGAHLAEDARTYPPPTEAA